MKNKCLVIKRMIDSLPIRLTGNPAISRIRAFTVCKIHHTIAHYSPQFFLLIIFFLQKGGGGADEDKFLFHFQQSFPHKAHYFQFLDRI